MGGNALKHLGVERKSKKDYQDLCVKVCRLIAPISLRSGIVPAYRDKEDFGDMDVLVIPKNPGTFKDDLQSQFKPREIYYNGGCYSLDVENFQIDFLVTTEENFDISLHYYSYNDVNNLIGRSSHRMGLKYGHLGLTLPVRYSETNLVAEINLSKDPRSILDFLDYSYSRFAQGFDSLENIFEYITTSRYFDPESFKFENLNHINRIRNRKRPTFATFVEWLEERPHLIAPIPIINKDDYKHKALVHFNKISEYNEINSQLKRREYIKSKFNGKLVKSITGLDGKGLGVFIADFKNHIEHMIGFNDWVVYSREVYIESQIKSFYLNNPQNWNMIR